MSDTLATEGERKITEADIPEIARKLNCSFENIRTPVSYSIADIMLGCRDLLLGKKEHICADVYGFGDTPYGIEKEITLSKKDIVSGAEQIKDGCFLPTEIVVGDTRIGPADWLFGAMEALMGADTVTLKPRPQLPSLDIIPETRDAYFKGTWRHSDSFEDKYLSHRLRMQAWTLRFPKVDF